MAIGTPVILGKNTSASTIATSWSVSLTTNIAIGDFVIVTLARNGTQAFSAPTDSGGNTYTQGAQNNTSGGAAVYYCTSATAIASSVTVNQTAGSKACAIVAKYPGAGSVGANTGTNSSGSASVATVTTTLADAANNWAVAALAYRSTTAATANTGNLRDQQASTASSATSDVLVDNTGSASVVCSANIPAATAFTAASIEIIPAVSGGTTNHFLTTIGVGL